MKIKSIYPFCMYAISLFLVISCSKDGDTPNNTVTDIDGNVYHTVTIGSQVWMVENLRVTHYNNGDTIFLTSFKTYKTTSAYTNYSNKPDTSKIYGCLYNWYAVNDSRKIAPKGWHVATADEWNTLIVYLGGENIAGNKLKEAGTTHWRSPNEGATNASGFTALPGGSPVYPIGHIGLWWTATSVDADVAFYYKILTLSQGAYKCNDTKQDMFSVRCVKDK